MTLTQTLHTRTADTWALSDAQCRQLAGYIETLTQWNQSISLTALKTERDIIDELILDSLHLCPHLPAGRYADIGSGNGAPGIILAIALPDSRFTLIDKSAKKARFLTHLKGALQLPNVEVQCGNVERYQPDRLFDGIVAKAFAAYDTLLHLTEHLLKNDGAYWLLKSARELCVLSENWQVTSHPYVLRGAEREVVEIRRILRVF